jgi:putative NIF3 family GTP cyclohydrolase 1 type 2
MNSNDILTHMLENSPWVNRESTVDTVKIGDADKAIYKVGVCWYPDIKTIQSAIDVKCDLLITHEPAWWDHFDKPGGWREKGPGLKKSKLLEESGLVLMRLHDTWDNWPELGIRDSFAKGLGLDKFIAEDQSRWHGMYEVPEQTLSLFAQYVAAKVAPLGENTVQVIGDPDMRISRPSIGVGCGGPHEDMIALGSDVLIMCYDGASYWKERNRFAEQGVGVITLEHGTTELWGLESLARYIQETWPELDVIYLDDHWKVWYVHS